MKYGLKQENIDAIIEVFDNYSEVEQAVIYGSRAKGNYKPASDIDLTLKGDKLNTTIVNKIAWELDDLLLPYTFDLSIFHHISNPDLLAHIERVGQLFYKKKNSIGYEL